MVQAKEPEAHAPIVFGENLRITVAANQGGRRYMEDRCVVHTERDEKGVLEWTFVGVFDGHGGEHASEYVRRNLLNNITKNQKFSSDDDEHILEAVRQGFLMTHEQMRDVYEEWPYTASGFPSTAGTTVSCVFIRNGKLYTGHVGDSAIYLGTVSNGELTSSGLTVDHKPESAHEQLRIAKAGGETAVKSGVTRVIWKRESRMNQLMRNPPNPPVMDSIPFLSVARSLGDLWSYNEKTNMFVVSPEPDLGVHKLTGNDFCLVLASDGMTNVLTGDQAISIVFREEELVEINEEINRNHSRCILRTALQKWRTLRADNITVATVIFDIDPLSYTENEMLQKVDNCFNVSQTLTDRPDGMLKISKTDTVLLATQRSPIIYNGSRDDNYCRVNYKGPGFRSHEEEIMMERKHLMAKFTDGGGIAIAEKPSPDSIRGPRIVEDIQQQKKPARREVEDLEYDDDEDDEDDDEDDDDDGDDEEEGVESDALEEVNLNLRFTETSVTVVQSPSRPSRPHAPRPVFADDSIFESEDVHNVQSTSSSSITPVRSPGNTVRRIKAEAVRKLRSPKIDDNGTSSASSGPTLLPETPDRRVTRSVSRAAINAPPTPSTFSVISPMKTTPPMIRIRGPIIGIAEHLSPDARLPEGFTPRRSIRLQGSEVTPGTSEPASAKLTASRKRPRTIELAMSGVTPVVAGLSLQDRLVEPNRVLPVCIIPSISTPSRSAPSSPKRLALKTWKWSLSKLDEKKKNEEIIRVSEVADDDDEEDVMREPPSKIRRFFGQMKKIFWGK